ncbi:hypothetical protein I3843_03G208000 [Carya illinoinensis]|nr:hypothetical protein I3843_03G208000 [Carya illinoinensis]
MFKAALESTVPNEPDVETLVPACTANFGDYQCNNAMGLWSKIKGKQNELKGPLSVGQAIIQNLPQSEMIESCSVAGPGFVNAVLSKDWMAKSLQKMLVDGIGTWAPRLPIKRAIEMHVGHLRSTIIGDKLARMLEFSNVEVLRRNHVGDWETQFVMLIEFLFENFSNWEDANETAVRDLQAFYKASKQRFGSDREFKEKAQKAVVRLQAGEAKYHGAWAQICDISRNEYNRVYQCLGGESFYNPYIPDVLKELTSKNLVEDMLLAMHRYRLSEEKAEWIIYLTDIGQQQHFDMVFRAAKRAGWLPAEDNTYPKVTHVGFVVQLVDLLDEAKSRSKTALIDRGKDVEWTEEELEQTAGAVGYGAVKYADFKNNRLTNYTFNFDQMLNDKGNTAVYLLYSHARICSIIRKSGKNIEDLKNTGAIMLDHVDERALGLHLLQFSEIVEEACTNLLPNVFCEYLYNLSENFIKFYSNCQVVGSAAETSRLLLCEATATVMRKCFYLLGNKLSFNEYIVRIALNIFTRIIDP